MREASHVDPEELPIKPLCLLGWRHRLWWRVDYFWHPAMLLRLESLTTCKVRFSLMTCPGHVYQLQMIEGSSLASASSMRTGLQYHAEVKSLAPIRTSVLRGGMMRGQFFGFFPQFVLQTGHLYAGQS